jgi:hypothetical protein
VKDQAWLKLLDVVSHKLGAADARLEIGGKDPEDPHLIWVALDDMRRLVVVFAEPPRDRDDARNRLSAILDTFRETLGAPAEPPGRSAATLRRELDHALAGLTDRTGAETAWIIDVHSPVLWGASESHDSQLDVDSLIMNARADQMLLTAKLTWAELLAATPIEATERLRSAGLSGVALRTVQDELEALRELAEEGGLAAAGRRLRSARALLEIRERGARERELVRTELRGPEIQCFAHSIAGQYQLVLVFDETYSPLHAEGNVQRALPHIERLLLSLPPVDPLSGGNRGAKVIRLPRSRG